MELIVADDSSTERTGEIAHQHGARAAQGDLPIFIDADTPGGDGMPVVALGIHLEPDGADMGPVHVPAVQEQGHQIERLGLWTDTESAREPAGHADVNAPVENACG